MRNYYRNLWYEEDRPIQTWHLGCGSACIIKSWNLSSEDICFNCMPLSHIGGIARNLLSVLFSGGDTYIYIFSSMLVIAYVRAS